MEAGRHWRICFRRPGYKAVEFKVPPGYRGVKATLANSSEFLTAYLSAMKQPVASVAPGEKRAAYGTVAWLVVEYLASLDFIERPKSMKDKHRRYIEDFRKRRGALLVEVIEQEDIEKMFAKLIEKPSKANQWLDAIYDLMKYAVKRKLLAANPAADIKKRPPKNPDGHHTWTLEEVAKAREKFPFGTRMRLAIELMNALAFRRSDVIRVGPPNTYAGTLDDGRPATILKYTQFKNRERHASHIETPIPADVLAVIKATPTVGFKTWLVDGRGKPFKEWAFNHWFAREIKAAGLPERCTPHGLRKRCCTDLADKGWNTARIQSISGHLTSKEVDRYTKMANRAQNARAVMKDRV